MLTTRHLALTSQRLSTDRCARPLLRPSLPSPTRTIRCQRKAAATVCSPPLDHSRRQCHKHKLDEDAAPNTQNLGLRELYTWRRTARLQVSAGANRKGNRKSLLRRREL